jgi:hypothetical protein
VKSWAKERLGKRKKEKSATLSLALAFFGSLDPMGTTLFLSHGQLLDSSADHSTTSHPSVIFECVSNANARAEQGPIGSRCRIIRAELSQANGRLRGACQHCETEIRTHETHSSDYPCTGCPVHNREGDHTRGLWSLFGSKIVFAVMPVLLQRALIQGGLWPGVQPGLPNNKLALEMMQALWKG